jgi:hypothetical protein
METKWAEFWAAAAPAILAVVYALAAKYLAGVVGWLLEHVIEGIGKLKLKLNENKYLAIAQFDDWLFDKLGEAVAATKDAFVDAVKAASADGKLTKEEAKAATEKAVETFKAGLSAIETRQITTMLGEDAWAIVKARVPAVVAAMKTGTAVAVAEITGAAKPAVAPEVSSDPPESAV